MSIKSVLCFLIDKCYIRSVKRYCFVRQYAAVPVQLEIVIIQCIIIIIVTIVTIIIIIKSHPRTVHDGPERK